MPRYLLPSALVVLLLVLATPSVAQHTHTGTCAECHTMHNSQDGQPMRFDGLSSPLPLMLRADCVNCHLGLGIPPPSPGLGAVASSAAKVSGSSRSRKFDMPNSPQVISHSPPTYTWGDSSGISGGTLAGGSFYWVAGNDAYGHNVTAIPGVLPDMRHGTTPPGGAAMGSPVQCAGTNGCHGDAEVSSNPLLAMAGAHHINASGEVDGRTVGSSFRFLLGVQGIEDPDWEWTVSATDHNHYVGEVRKVDTSPPRAGTMSGFCAKCHGDFHNSATGKAGAGEGGQTGFSSPWVRHPNDYDMTQSGEYAGYVTYDSKAPLARTTGTLSAGADSSVGANQRVIMCLTCHRAHGSPNYAMLRWNYRAWPGPRGQDGCQVCHSSKF